MKRIVLTYGLISGVLLGIMVASMPLWIEKKMSLSNSEVVGYSSMVLAYLTVFFGIRAYRERTGGGSISFGKAFQVGILITLITCAVYVITWEIVYFNFIPDFADRYSAHVLNEMRAKGASAAKLAAEAQNMARFKELYANPFINAGMTFLEIFPVGLIMTLVSAAILRRKPGAGVPAPATA